MAHGKKYRAAYAKVDREKEYAPAEAIRLIKETRVAEFAESVEITVYEDRSFDFITKTPPAAVLIKEAIGIKSGSGEPHVNKVGTISMDQVRQIAERKMPDLNANDLDAASKIIAGTARSMGVDVK